MYTAVLTRVPTVMVAFPAMLTSQKLYRAPPSDSDELPLIHPPLGELRESKP